MNQAAQAMPPVKVRSRFAQFSVKALLILLSVCCVLMAMAVLPPLAVIVLSLSSLATAVFCVTAAIFGRGWIRPFAILAGISLIIGFVMIVAAPFHHPAEVAIAMGVNLLMASFVGFSASLTHGFLKRRGGVVPIPNVPFVRDVFSNPDVEIK